MHLHPLLDQTQTKCHNYINFLIGTEWWCKGAGEKSAATEAAKTILKGCSQERRVLLPAEITWEVPKTHIDPED